MLQTLKGVAPANSDLIAPAGFVDAGDAGIRVSGNLNIAAVQVLNAGNIQVGGTKTGVPVVIAPDVAGLTAAGNAAGAAAKTADSGLPTGSTGQNQPSVIIVEVLGYGGGDGDTPRAPQYDDRQQKGKDQRSYNPNSPIQVVGAGALNQAADRYLTEAEKKALLP